MKKIDLLNPLLFFILFQLVAFLIIPSFALETSDWDNVKKDVYISLAISFSGYIVGYFFQKKNLRLKKIKIKPIFSVSRISDQSFLKYAFLFTLFFITLQIIFRVSTNTLILGSSESVKGNLLTSFLGYILMFFGMSHTGTLFFSFLSVISILLLKQTGQYRWLVTNILIYFSLSVITTQKALLILPVLVCIVAYHYLIERIGGRRIFKFSLFIPFFLLWAVTSNYLRWANMNDVSTSIIGALNTIEFNDALDYFVARFDFYLSASYALNQPELYPGSLVDMVKSFLFIVPYNTLYGDGIFPVKFALAYRVPGHESGVGVTVPLVVDLSITYGYLLTFPVSIIVGYIFSKLHSSISKVRNVKSSTIYSLVLIPVFYISAATVPLFELNYNILRSLFFTANYLFTLRISYFLFFESLSRNR
ncbi:O-antigen polymerase [Grimontia hollisae]|uniref:O-antigen polymerase n=1 Tax=Grimontia hollisae TaxID=673 RepID=UPI0012ACC5B8|nr:O-antigen polymerase [Grimontia hollisae]